MGTLSKLIKLGSKTVKKTKSVSPKSKILKTAKKSLKDKTGKKMLNQVKTAAGIGAAGNIALGMHVYNKNKKKTPVAKQVITRAKAAAKKK